MNPNNYTNTKEFRGTLLEPVKKLLEGEKFAVSMLNITTNNHLRIDEAGELENEIGLVLIGLENPKNFVQNLKSHVGLPHDKAVALAEDVNKEIFTPLREDLKTLWGSGPRGPETSSPSGDKARGSNMERGKPVGEQESPIRPSEKSASIEPSAPKESKPHDIKQASGANVKEGLADAGVFAGAAKIVEEKMTQPTKPPLYKGVDPYRESTE